MELDLPRAVAGELVSTSESTADEEDVRDEAEGRGEGEAPALEASRRARRRPPRERAVVRSVLTHCLHCRCVAFHARRTDTETTVATAPAGSAQTQTAARGGGDGPESASTSVRLPLLTCDSPLIVHVLWYYGVFVPEDTSRLPESDLNERSAARLCNGLCCVQGASTPTASLSLSVPESPRLASSLPPSAPQSARRTSSGTSALSQPPPAVPPSDSATSTATATASKSTPTPTAQPAPVASAALHEYSPVPMEADERAKLLRQIEQLQHEVRFRPCRLWHHIHTDTDKRVCVQCSVFTEPRRTSG